LFPIKLEALSRIINETYVKFRPDARITTKVKNYFSKLFPVSRCLDAIIDLWLNFANALAYNVTTQNKIETFCHLKPLAYFKNHLLLG
jgi:predicted flavoprotein YhiN